MEKKRLSLTEQKRVNCNLVTGQVNLDNFFSNLKPRIYVRPLQVLYPRVQEEHL